MTQKEQKIALITGASKGIGEAISLKLADDGFDIWLNYRSDHKKAEEVAKQIEAKKRECILLPFNVADTKETEKKLAPLLETVTPYVLVNNAGITKDSLMALMHFEDWEKVLNVHLNGFFNVTKLVSTKMLRKREGRIINITSTSGESGNPGQINYSVAKAGLIGATKSLAKELGKRNILVNAVSPGFIKTQMVKELPLEHILPMIPLGRIGLPDEVASVVSFLSSSNASYITGQIISVNGGIYI